MTGLEKTIKQIMMERNRIVTREKAQQGTRTVVDQKTQQYTAEFDALYGKIPAVAQMEQEFVAWADKCTINDGEGRITSGAGVYKDLLQSARSAYQQFREEGYESQTAFDKGTSDLAAWIHDATQKRSGGIIYLNHSQQFLSRMRKMSDDW